MDKVQDINIIYRVRKFPENKKCAYPPSLASILVPRGDKQPDIQNASIDHETLIHNLNYTDKQALKVVPGRRQNKGLLVINRLCGLVGVTKIADI